MPVCDHSTLKVQQQMEHYPIIKAQYFHTIIQDDRQNHSLTTSPSPSDWSVMIDLLPDNVDKMLNEYDEKFVYGELCHELL